MATLNKYKEISTWDGKPEIISIRYDFSVDAGAVGVLDIFKAIGAHRVLRAMMKVQTTCTSGGAATVSVGKAADLTGIIAATAVASLVAGVTIYGAAADASHNLAADAIPQMEIATAALTAGVIDFEFEVLKF